MKITVKNFGPIAEANNIEISPMTIFVGPSNTGKSYLAMLIYSIFRTFTKDDYPYDGLSFNVYAYVHFLEKSKKRNLVNNLKKSRRAAFSEIEKHFLVWADMVSEAWRSSFVDCFGEEGKKIIEAPKSDKSFSVKVTGPEKLLVLDLTEPEKSKLSARKKEELYQQIKEALSAAEEQEYENRIGDASERRENWFLIEQSERVVSKLFSQLFSQFHVALSGEATAIPYYLPAVRGGIIQSHRTLVSTLIKRASRAGLDETPSIPLFNGVFADFMRKLIDLGSRVSVWGPTMGRELTHGPDSGARERIEKIGGDMEAQVLSGKVHVQKEETQYPDFRYRFRANGEECDLPLMSASSSVSELAPISLFIRHYLDVGNLFIVEEPEAHLHPGAQRQVAGVLAQLANAGVKVLITTHSDIIIEQISNFVYAAKKPGSGKVELKEEECSVYWFNRLRMGKTRVKEALLDPDLGFLTKDHLDVSSKLYSEAVSLMERGDNVGD